MDKYKIVSITLLVFLSSLYSVSSFSGVSYQFDKVTGHWYSIIPIAMSWSEANKAAKSAGGYLASITSGEENKWISDTFGATYNDDYYWFGGNDIGSEGIWHWSNGEPWEYSNWNSGEPNNSNGIENALTWYHVSGSNEDGYTWNDRDPSEARASLVEYNSSLIYNNETGHWYSINPISMSWNNAKEAAESAGGYLASITSGEENKWISDTFGVTYNDDYYWFGGNDIGSEGIWQWSNGEPWAYSNWNGGEPNNSNGIENTLTWYHESRLNEDGYTWNDRDPLQSRASLIEFNTHPLQALLDAWIDNRWSGDSPQSLIRAIKSFGFDIRDVEEMLLQGRARYPDAQQPKGVITRGIPIDTEHAVYSSQYLMYVPTNYNKEIQTPLIVVGHGGSTDMGLGSAELAAISGMNPWISFAEQHGFLMVAPLTAECGWGNIGYSILFSTLSQVQQDYNVDPNHVYITGHSMGGHLSYRSGIYLGDRWAAISPMSGGYDYVTSGLVENLYNVPGFATWGEKDIYGIELHNRKIRDWMDGHGFPWENWEKPGGGHAIFQEYVDDVGNLFLANSRNLYRQSVFAGAGPWRSPGGLDIPNLQFDAADQNSCSSVAWRDQRPIPASTFHWLRLRPANNANIVQRAWAVNKGNNLFEITSENVREAVLYLHPAMVDFDIPVIVKVNGEIIFNDLVEFDLATMLNLVREFDDRGRIFHAAIDLVIGTDLAPHEPSFYDINNDGCVDRDDLNIIIFDIRDPAPNNTLYDLNGDRNVNIADARFLVTRFTNPRGLSCN